MTDERAQEIVDILNSGEFDDPNKLATAILALQDCIEGLRKDKARLRDEVKELKQKLEVNSD